MGWTVNVGQTTLKMPSTEAESTHSHAALSTSTKVSGSPSSQESPGNVHVLSASVAVSMKLQAVESVQPRTYNSSHTPSRSASFRQTPSQS